MATTLIEQSSKAVGQNSSTLVFPILPLIGQIVRKEILTLLNYCEHYTFQLVILVFFVVCFLINTTAKSRFSVQNVGNAESRISCLQNEDCKFNGSSYYDINRSDKITFAIFLISTFSKCDPSSFWKCQQHCPAFHCQLAREYSDSEKKRFMS